VRKVAAVFSGGGAKIGFHNGAKDYLMQKLGYRFDVVAGVSAGALVAAMVAQEKGDLLTEICEGLSNEDVYTGSLNAWRLFRIALGADSIFGNKPLQKLIADNVDVSQFKIPCIIGAVDLVDGEYGTFSPQEIFFKQALLASTAIPVVWPPVKVLAGQWVDGGVRNISPIADVLWYEPDEVVIVNCSSREPMPAAGSLNNGVKIGMRALDIACQEIFENDVETFLRMNRLVEEAAAAGVTLHHSDGHPYKCYQCLVIEPTEDLGPTLEFSPELNRRRYEHGWQRAKEVCDAAVA
jgi:NTE family protein